MTHRQQVRGAHRRDPHRHLRARRRESVVRVNGMPRMRQVYRPAAGDGQDARAAARLRRRHRPDHRPAGHAGGHRGPDRPARRRTTCRRLTFERSTPRLVEPDTEDEPAPAVPREQLDRQAADRPADRGARRGDAGAHQPPARTRSSATCGRRTSASTGSTRSRRSRSTR